MVGGAEARLTSAGTVKVTAEAVEWLLVAWELLEAAEGFRWGSKGLELCRLEMFVKPEPANSDLAEALELLSGLE